MYLCVRLSVEKMWEEECRRWKVEEGKKKRLDLLGLLKFKAELPEGEGWRGKPRPGSSLAGNYGASRAAGSRLTYR